MQNRKKVNQEIERKKRGQRRLSAIITTVVVAAIVLALVWIVWDVRSRGWIVNFEGNRIATSDMQFHAAMMGISPNEPATQDFLVSSIVESEVLIQRAEAAGLWLTDEEREELLEVARANREWIPAVPVERAAELFGVLEFASHRLLERYGTYEPDPAAFAREFAEYLEVHRADYEMRSTQAQIIATSDRDALVEVKEEAALVEAADFTEFARETCMFYDPEHGVLTASIVDFIEWFGLLDYTGELLELQQGETSSIIEFEEGQYLLIFMLERQNIVDSEIEDMFRERMVAERSFEKFRELIDSWIAEANYTVNERALAR